MEIEPKRQFELWAKGHSGYEGGNFSGALWFCGIEHGGEFSEGQIDFPDVSGPPSIKEEYRAEFISYPYNWKLVKLYSAILGESVSNYRAVYEKTKAFSVSSDVLKLNLYPIAFYNFDENNWTKWLYEATGFPTKSLYQSWCQLNRFPIFLNLVKHHNPKVIICTGTSLEKEFIMAFSGLNNAFLELESVSFGSKEAQWGLINDSKTLLFVTPFLGRSLSSNNDITRFGKEISRICRSVHGPNWCKYLIDKK